MEEEAPGAVLVRGSTFCSRSSRLLNFRVRVFKHQRGGVALVIGVLGSIMSTIESRLRALRQEPFNQEPLWIPVLEYRTGRDPLSCCKGPPFRKPVGSAFCLLLRGLGGPWAVSHQTRAANTSGCLYMSMNMCMCIYCIYIYIYIYMYKVYVYVYMHTCE